MNGEEKHGEQVPRDDMSAERTMVIPDEELCRTSSVGRAKQEADASSAVSSERGSILGDLSNFLFPRRSVVAVGSVSGCQIGIVNYAGRMDSGAQIGLVNIIAHGGFSPVLPIVNGGF